MNNKGHIVFCGYTDSSETVLKELGELIRERGVIILSKKPVPSAEGITHLPIDYLNIENLKNLEMGLKGCSACVVFAEFKSDEAPEVVDMHSILTCYNIKKEYPDVPIIVEMLDNDNKSLIENLNCEDVIFKESIDLNLITGCILHPNISPIIYDLLTVQGKQLKSTNIEEIALRDETVTFRDVRLHGLEVDVTFIGYVGPNGKTRLMPPNNEEIFPDYQLVYIT